MLSNEIITNLTSSGKALSVNVNPNLENVTEWLKKSFDQTLQSNTDTASNYKSIQYLTPQKQYRSNSISNTCRIITDEPIVEINLNRNFYLKKQQKSDEEKHKRSLQTLNDNLSSNNFVSNYYSTYSKSHTPLFSDENSGNLIMKFKINRKINIEQ